MCLWTFRSLMVRRDADIRSYGYFLDERVYVDYCSCHHSCRHSDVIPSLILDPCLLELLEQRTTGGVWSCRRGREGGTGGDLDTLPRNTEQRAARKHGGVAPAVPRGASAQPTRRSPRE
jgi:hypothetical protein